MSGLQSYYILILISSIGGMHLYVWIYIYLQNQHMQPEPKPSSLIMDRGLYHVTLIGLLGWVARVLVVYTDTMSLHLLYINWVFRNEEGDMKKNHLFMVNRNILTCLHTLFSCVLVYCIVCCLFQWKKGKRLMAILLINNRKRKLKGRRRSWKTTTEICH